MDSIVMDTVLDTVMDTVDSIASSERSPGSARSSVSNSVQFFDEGEIDSFMRDRSRRQLCFAAGPQQSMENDDGSLEFTDVQPGRAVQVDPRLTPGC